jgi:large repetitive protein
MNAPVLLAQLSGSSPQTSAPPKNLKLEKPQNGQAVTVHLDGNTKLDFSDVASEKLTFVRVGDKLIVLFDNQSTVTVDPVFDSTGHPLPNVAFEMATDRTLTGDEFASLFPITTDQSILPAAGNGSNGPTAGAHFGDPTVDPLTSSTPLALLAPETFGSSFDVVTDQATNPTPIAGTVDVASINEDGLAGGNPGGAGDVPGALSVTRSLHVNFGTNAIGRSFSFAADQSGLANLTSDGQAVHLFVTTVGGLPTMIGYVGTDSSIAASQVFTISLDANSTIDGTYTFTLLRPLDHPILGTEDTLNLTVNVTATDGSGDHVNTVIHVDVNDDTPVIIAANETHSTLVDPVLGTIATQTGSLGISWGADRFNDHVDGGVSATNGHAGDRAVVFSDAQVAATGHAGDASSTIASLTSFGQTVHYALLDNGTVLLAYTGDVVPALPGTSGGEGGDGPRGVSPNIVFTVTLSDASDTGSYVITQYHPLDHGSGAQTFDSIDLSFHFTATDSDGDPVSGTLTATITDTVPVSTGPIGDHAVIESTVSGGSPDFAPFDGPALEAVRPIDGNSFVVASTGAVSLNIDWHADSNNPTSEAGAHDRSVAFAADMLTTLNGLDLSSNGQALTYTITDNAIGQLLTATAGEDTHAVFTVQLSDSGNGSYTFTLLDNLDHPAGHGANDEPLTFSVVATDSDGDPVATSFTVDVKDDVPVTPANAIMAIDEHGLVGSSDISVSSSNAALAPGADGFFGGGLSTAINFSTLPSGLETASGAAVTITTSGATVTGMVGSNVVFTLTVAADGTYTYHQDQTLFHSGAGADVKALDFGFTITDGDGDVSSAATITVDVTDDAPVAPANAIMAIDEHGLVGSSDISVSSSNAALTPGADGFFGGGLSTAINFSTLPSGLETASGAAVTITTSGATVTGMAGSNVVFTLTVAADGTYTYHQDQPLFHGGPGTDIKELDFGFTITDGDGDVSSAATITVDVKDDVPIARDDSDSTGAGATATGNVISGASTDHPATGADTVGADGAKISQIAGYAGASDSSADGSHNFQVAGQYGNLVINEDGSYTYTRAATSVDAATDTFTYTLTDSDGDSSPATLTINLAQQNLLVVGSQANDVAGATAIHTVASPIADHGVVQGQGGNDILVGDPGGATPAIAGQVANFVFVLDTSGSIGDQQLALMKTSVDNMLASLGDSHAQDVRVNIVSFDESATNVGTFDLISGGVVSAAAVSQAIDAVNALESGDSTNYEAGLQQALQFIQGGSTTISVDREISSFDANSAGGSSNNDTAYIIGHGSTQIALVSGWNSPGTSAADLVDATGSINNGFGVGDFEVNPGELLRFDFGAFKDFDGTGSYNNAGGFNGIPVSSATYTLQDNNSFGSTKFSYVIHFTDNSTQNGSQTINGSADITLTSAGKLIDYVEFSVTSGQGDVDLQSVVTTVSPGALPNANTNQLIFISDGQPNEAVDSNGNPIDVSQDEAIRQILGTSSSDNVSEVAAVKTDGDGTSPDQAFVVQAFGLNSNSTDLVVLGQVEGGTATNLTSDGNGLTSAYAGVIAGIAGTPAGVAAAGSDTINGGAGNDLIFGDVLNTDTLATSHGIDLPAGSGWAVFALLETGTVTGYTSWTRADTLNYIQSHQLELSAESGRSGGNDVINGGAGDDTVYGQEGNDQITGGLGNDTIHAGSGNDTIYYTVGDGNDVVDGGSGSDTLEITNSGGAQVFNIGTVTGGPEIVPTTGANATDIQVTYGASNIRMDGIEDIVIHLGSGGDTVHVLTSLNGTALDTSTINIVGGAGDDTVDLTGRGTGDIHRVVADGGANSAAGDTLKLDFGYSAVTGVVTISGGFQITHNGITDVFTNFENFQFTDVTRTYSQLLTAPTAPSIVSVTDNVPLYTGSVTNGGVTNDATLGVQVSLGAGALAGDSVQLFNGTTALGSAVVLTSTDIANGYANVTTPTLADGTYHLDAETIDPFSGASNASATFTVTVDTVAPTAAVAITAIASDTGSSPSDFITNDTTLTVSGSHGTLGSGEKVQVSSDGGATWSDVTTSTGSTWSYTDPTTHNTSFTYQARIVDAAGNVDTHTASQAITIDTTAPTAAVAITAIFHDTGTSSSDFITSDTRLTVSGTHGALGSGEKVQVSSNGGASWSDVTSFDSTTWSYTDPTTHNTSFTYQARIVDAAGNVDTNTASQSITIDTTPPGSLSGQTLDLLASSDSGSSSTDNLTNVTTPTVQVSSLHNVAMSVGDVIEVIDTSNGNAVVGSHTVVAGDLSGGVWSGATQSITLTTLGDGGHALKVELVDVAGNIGTPSTAMLTVTEDTTVAAPGAALHADTGSSGSDRITSNGQIDVTLASDAVSWQYSTDGGSHWTTGSGTSFTLAAGSYAANAVEVQQTDIAGNVSSITGLGAITVDKTAPTAAVAITAILHDTGSSSSDFITNDTTLTVSGTHGTLGSGEKVQVSSDGATWSDVTTSDSTTWSYTDPTTHNSSFTYQTRVVDTAGNVGNIDSQAITIDTTVAAPGAALHADTGSSGSDRITSNGQIDVTLASDVASWQYSTDGGSHWTTGSGTSFTLAAGSYAANTVEVRQTDIAGNLSSATNLAAITVDTTAPTAAVAVTAIANDTGSSASDFITKDTTLTVSGTHGTLGSGEKVQVSSDGGATWSDATTSGSTWSYADPAAHNSSFSYQARIVDTAGNVDANTDSQTITIDTSAAAPGAMLHADTGSSASDRITSNGQIDVTLASDVASWQYSVDGGSHWTTGSGTSFTLAAGSYTANAVEVRQTDIAGNVSSITNLAAITVDQTVVPPGAALHADTGSSGSDRITSNGQIDVSLASDVASWQYSTDGGSTWTTGSSSSFTLAPGSYAANAIEIRQTDIAGNASSTTNLAAITVDQMVLPPAAALHADTGSSASDRITSNGQIDVTLASDVASWQYSVDGGSHWTTGSGTSFTLAAGSYAANAVEIRQTDIAGNISSTTNLAAITIDQTVAAPGAMLHADTGSSGSDGVTSNGQIDVTLASDVSSWQYSVDGGSHWTTGSGTSFTLAAGSYAANAIEIRQTDIAGNVSSTTNLAAITVDQMVVPPNATLHADTGSSASDGITSNGQIDVTLAPDVASWQYSTDGGSHWTTGSGTSFTLAAGSYAANAIEVRQTDIAGNVSITNLAAITVDTTAPTVTIATDDSGLTGTDVAHLTFTLSEASSNFAANDIVVSGGSLSNFAAVDATHYTATFTPAANSTTSATIDVAANAFTDAAGNSSTAASQLTMTVNTLTNHAPDFGSGTVTGAVTGQVGVSPSDQLVNGNFEAGATGWSVASQNGGTTFIGSFPHDGGINFRAGSFGTFTGVDAQLAQTVQTLQGVQYTLTFYVASTSATPAGNLVVNWNGTPVDTITESQLGGAVYHQFTVQVTGTGGADVLQFAIHDPNNNPATADGWYVDTVSLTPSAHFETTSGAVAFTDADASDTHSVTVSPAGGSYIGQFVSTVNEANHQVKWTFFASDAQIQAISSSSVNQTYTLTINDGHGGTDTQDVTVTLTRHPDSAPVITSSTQTGSVTEDASIGVVNLVQNPTFELPDIFHPVLTPWTVSGAGHATILGSGANGSVDAVTLDPNTTISQTISTVVGTTYTVDYFLENFGTPFTLTENGVTISSQNGIFANWQEFSATFTATSTSTTLAFATTGVNGIRLDEVSVQTGTHHVVSGFEQTSGAITFDDADLTDTHTASAATPTFVWSGGSLTSAQLTALTNASALTLAMTDSTGSGHGSVAWTYQIADSAIQFLGNGQTLTETYAVTVDDGHGGVASQNVTVTVNGVTPVVTGEAITSATGMQGNWLNAGDVVSVAVTMNEAMTVTGTPHLALNIGGSTVQASYASGSGSSSLVFTYTILAGQNDSNGISIGALTLNGGTINDAAGRAASLSFGGVTDNASYEVDTTAPTVTVSETDSGGNSGTGTVTFKFSEAVSGFTNSDITLTKVALGGTLVHDGMIGGFDTYHESFTYSSGANKISVGAGTYTDVAGNSGAASNTLSFPAGVSGEPINLALTAPSTDHVGAISLSVAGIPAGWHLSEGSHNSDGTWSVQTNDIGSLSVTSPESYTGALVLQVTENWTNADGSVGNAFVADNVEAYAKGSPIFAWSGDDNLTASSGNDTLVFANKIGTDVVHNFDTAHDQIDLIGFAGVSSFADIQAHLANDANGNARITLADGESITLTGVDAGSLTAADFVFDQTPVTHNSGTMVVSDGALLPISGIVDNSGGIQLGSTGNETDLEVVQHGVTLQGGGTLTLSDNAGNVIFGSDADVTLTNVDNTISGAGQLGDGQMTLVNEGSIIATGSNALVIGTGANSIVNSGTLEATGSGGLVVHSGVASDGVLWANGGNVTLDGDVSGSGSARISATASLAIGGAFNERIVFDDGAAGTLKLDHSADFSGILTGFGGNDVLDLSGILGASATLSYTENAQGTGGTLSVTDGTHTANIAFTGQYTASDFHVAADPGYSAGNHALVQLEHQAQQLAAAA